MDKEDVVQNFFFTLIYLSSKGHQILNLISPCIFEGAEIEKIQ